MSVLLTRKYPLEDEAFLRSVTFPEEERHLYRTKPWDGGYRWFRSENVICLEHYRLTETKSASQLKAS